MRRDPDTKTLESFYVKMRKWANVGQCLVGEQGEKGDNEIQVRIWSICRQ